MKTFQQNLLVVLALSLCALCAYQWYSQARQRNDIGSLKTTVDQKLTSIQEYTNRIGSLEHQLAQMDASLTELSAAAKTNDVLLLSQRRELKRLAAESESLTNQLAQYRQAVDSLQDKLKSAYDGVSKQNDAIKLLTSQRDEYVSKYNDAVTNRNDIVSKYNELAARLAKLQPAGGRQ